MSELKFENPASVYKTAWADLPENAVIHKGMNGKYDVRADIAKAAGMEDGSFKNVYKALSTTLSTYSAGTLSVLIPVYVDPEVVDLTRRETPLVELIPRVKNYGKTADYNQITTISSAQALGEDAALAETNDAFTRRSVAMKYLYAVGRVTGVMWAASQPYLASGGFVDALALEVRNKTLALKRLEEAMILLGNSQADWTEPVNSTTISGTNSFDGLYNIITNANSCNLGGSATYGTDEAGVALSIPKLRGYIRSAATRGGMPNLIVCDYQTYDDVKSLIHDQLRYVNQTYEIAWGIKTMEFEGLPIIRSRFLSTTAGNGSRTPVDGKSLFVLDTSVIEMRVLQDVVYEEMAKTNDATKFFLKCYEALVVKAPQFCHVAYDIL